MVEALLRAGATVSGNPSSGWGFDVTARRIGFADEVLQEHDRKEQVLKLLIEAEAKETKTQGPQTASTLQSMPMDQPRAELLSPDSRLIESTSTTATALQETQAQDERPRSELPTPFPASVDRTSTATDDQTEHRPLSKLKMFYRRRSDRSPSAPARNNPAEPTSAYPSTTHIANAYGFDPFPQQQHSVTLRDKSGFSDDRIGPMSALSGLAVPSSADPVPALSPSPVSSSAVSDPPAREPPPPSPSVVHIGPDGMWRLNPNTSTKSTEGSTTIYEMGT